MKKFLVLNVALQPCNPVQFGFKKQATPDDETYDPYTANTPDTMFTLDEEEAKKFAEHMASTQVAGNQRFHLVEIKGTVKTKVPVEWT